MDKKIEKLKKELKDHFAGNDVVAIWENVPQTDKDGDKVINVGLSEGRLTLQQAQTLPAEIDGVKIVYHYEGQIKLMRTTDTYTPLIGGISIGGIDVSAGTLGGIVWDNETHEPYILTNEHVVSDTDNIDPFHPPVDFPIVQPGPVDGGKHLAGRLLKVGGMKKAALADKPCNIDAALVTPVRECESEKFWGIGHIDTEKHVDVNIGDLIVKSGRTTGVTTNIVAATNVSANITGIKWNNPVAMEGLIQSKSAFVQGGDSGSRVWRLETMEPIGIIFAGSWLTSLIIPAQTICDVFGIYFGVDGMPNVKNKSKVKTFFGKVLNFFRRILIRR